MRLTIPLAVVAALAALFPARPAWSAAGDPAARPNVIVMLLDDVGYGDFACHGNPAIQTPNIDKLYRESIRLTDFHVCPMCTPTRGQLLTGVSCLANGAMNVSSGRTPLRGDLPTMADLLADAGYKTGLFGKWHLGDNYPYRPEQRGFQQTLWCKSWGMASAADYFNNDCFDDYYTVNGQMKQLAGYNTDVFVGEAIKWMKERKEKKEPFFVYLPTTAAHGPLFVPDQYRGPYKKLRPNLASFFGMIANIDENVGKLDAFLQAEGLRDNTLVIFMTDNGGTAGVQFYNAGMRGNKQTLYEGGHRVPCFIRWPAGKLRPAGDLAGVTQVQDILPTLVDLCGLKKPDAAKFDGTSLAGVLRGQQTAVPDRVLIVQYSRLTTPQRPRQGDACVLWRNWRLVEDKELFDLKADPAQKENVIEKHPDVVEKLRTHYEQWWATVEPRLDELQPITVGSDAENPTRLCPCDWQDVHCDQSAQVRRGEAKNGPWNVLVEKEGSYEITLRRYPAESGLAITAAAPPLKGVDGEMPACVSLPIAKARLRIADVDQSSAVKEGETGVTFNVTLKPGRTQLQTWFYDAGGKELCGAYYTEVKRK